MQALRTVQYTYLLPGGYPFLLLFYSPCPFLGNFTFFALIWVIVLGWGSSLATTLQGILCPARGPPHRH